MKTLLGRVAMEGHDWESRARNDLQRPIKAVEKLDESVGSDPSIPIDPAAAVLSRLMNALEKVTDFDKQAMARLPDIIRLTSCESKESSIHSMTMLNMRQPSEFGLGGVSLSRMADSAEIVWGAPSSRRMM